MDKYNVEHRMHTLKNICEIFDELLAYDTGDDYWKRCVCEESLRGLEAEMYGDWEVTQLPHEVDLRREECEVIRRRLAPYKDARPVAVNMVKMREMYALTVKNFMDNLPPDNTDREGLRFLCSSFHFLLAKRCPTAYPLDYGKFMRYVKEKGIQTYADEVAALGLLIEQYEKY